jgi:hypothetical protein
MRVQAAHDAHDSLGAVCHGACTVGRDCRCRSPTHDLDELDYSPGLAVWPRRIFRPRRIPSRVTRLTAGMLQCTACTGCMLQGGCCGSFCLMIHPATSQAVAQTSKGTGRRPSELVGAARSRNRRSTGDRHEDEHEHKKQLQLEHEPKAGSWGRGRLR